MIELPDLKTMAALGLIPLLGHFARRGGRSNRRRVGNPAAGGTPAVNRIIETAAAATDVMTGSVFRKAAIVESSAAATDVITGEVIAGGYSPADEGGAVLWLDAQDTASWTDGGGTVTSITNKISSVAISTAAVTNFPTTTTINGHPAWQGNSGSSRGIRGAEAAVTNVLTNTHAYTCLYYMSGSEDANGAHVSAGATGSAANHSRYFGNNTTGTGNYQSRTTSSAGTISVVASVASSLVAGGHVVAWWSSGTSTSGSRNDAAADPSAAAQDPTAGGATLVPDQYGLFMRMDSAADTPSNSSIGEVWLFDSQLSGAAITRVHDYLAAKWA